MSTSKDAIVFLLDVRSTLWTTANKEKLSPLDKAIHAITQMIHQKIIDARKTDQISLILFNTDETKNPLASSNDDYKHISIIQSLETPAASTIHYLREKLVRPRESSQADLLDALIVAADLLITETKNKKSVDRRIFLLADCVHGPAMNCNGLSDVMAQLREYSIRLDLINLAGESEEGTTENNLKILGSVVEGVEGSVFELKEALALLSEFMTKRVRQVATFRGDLNLADSMRIPVQLFTKTSWQRLPSAHKHCSDGEVTRNLHYRVNNESISTEASTSEASRKHLIKAYRYGRSLIPFHRLDESEMALKTSKSLYLLGFLPANQVPRESFMSGAYAIVAEGGNPRAQTALSALIRGLYERDCVGLARYVRAEGNAPKLGVLIPRIKSAYESLLFIALPFAEDYRRYLFSPFLERVQLSADQNTAMTDWISSLNLMTAARSEDNGPMEALRPGDTYNVLFAHHYAAVQARVLHPERPVLEADESLLKHLMTPEGLQSAADERLERLKKLFPLKRQPQKRSQLESIHRLWQSSNEIEIANEIEVANDVEVTVKDSDNLPKVPTFINPQNAISDFLEMSNAKHQDLVQPALMQMMALIPRFVSAHDYELAFECFQQLRQVAVREDEFDLFNTFMREYRRQAAPSSPQLWSRLRDSQLTLISMLENAESPVTPEEAKTFFDELPSKGDP